MGNQDRQLRDYNVAVREQQVLKLRTQGYEFEEIARQTGYKDKSGAYKAYKRAVAAIPKPQAQEELQSSLMRLNAAIKALWAKVERGDTFAVERLISIEERRARLLGLDAKADQPATGQVLIREYSVAIDAV
jgi:AraC-like DNA-binding protein